MNALQIREILMKVQRDMKCPLCSSTIDSANIDIGEERGGSNSCKLKMECQECASIFGGVAQFSNAVTHLGKKLNASSRMKGNDMIDTFSFDDAHLIKESLYSCTSFAEMFPNPEKK